MEQYDDYDCPTKQAPHSTSISEDRPRPRHSIGNEPDPFVVYFTVRLRDQSLRGHARSLLRSADLVNILGGRPKTLTYNSVNDMVVQIKNEEQSSILSRTKCIRGVDVEITPHIRLNNVTGVIESEILWNEGSEFRVVHQLAHEGVVQARILYPIILQDGRKSFSVEVTFQKRSRLPLFVTTLQGEKLDVRVIVLPPRQCLYCFRYGHESFNCRERGAICENCSDFRDDHGQPCFRMTRCANCSSRRHGALSRHCFALYKSWRINILGYTECLKFMEAKKIIDSEVLDCFKKGGDYREEFPLSSRYFLVVPPEAFPEKKWSTVVNNSSDCVTCDYPEYHRLGRETGESQTLPALLDYYSTHDSTFSLSPCHGNVSPLGSSARQNNWSSLMKLSLSKTGFPEGNRPCMHPNYSPSSSPLYKSSSASNNTADTISLESEREVIEPMLGVIDVNNRFSDKIINLERLHNVNTRIGLFKFLATNLHLVSRCWMDEGRSRPRKSNVSSVSTDSGVVQCDSYENDGYSKYWDAEMAPRFTDRLSSYRCKLFVSGKKCDGRCKKLHRLPREDNVRCINHQYLRCRFGRTCNFLHATTQDTLAQSNHWYQGNTNHFEHCDRIRLGTRL